MLLLRCQVLGRLVGCSQSYWRPWNHQIRRVLVIHIFNEGKDYKNVCMGFHFLLLTTSHTYSIYFKEGSQLPIHFSLEYNIYCFIVTVIYGTCQFLESIGKRKKFKWLINLQCKNNLFSNIFNISSHLIYSICCSLYSISWRIQWVKLPFEDTGTLTFTIQFYNPIFTIYSNQKHHLFFTLHKRTGKTLIKDNWLYSLYLKHILKILTNDTESVWSRINLCSEWLQLRSNDLQFRWSSCSCSLGPFSNLILLFTLLSSPVVRTFSHW